MRRGGFLAGLAGLVALATVAPRLPIAEAEEFVLPEAEAVGGYWYGLSLDPSLRQAIIDQRLASSPLLKLLREKQR